MPGSQSTARNSQYLYREITLYSSSSTCNKSRGQPACRLLLSPLTQPSSHTHCPHSPAPILLQCLCSCQACLPGALRLEVLFLQYGLPAYAAGFPQPCPRLPSQGMAALHHQQQAAAQAPYPQPAPSYADAPGWSQASFKAAAAQLQAALQVLQGARPATQPAEQARSPPTQLAAPVLAQQALHNAAATTAAAPSRAQGANTAARVKAERGAASGAPWQPASSSAAAPATNGRSSSGAEPSHAGISPLRFLSLTSTVKLSWFSLSLSQQQTVPTLWCYDQLDGQVG